MNEHTYVYVCSYIKYKMPIIKMYNRFYTLDDLKAGNYFPYYGTYKTEHYFYVMGCNTEGRYGGAFDWNTGFTFHSVNGSQRILNGAWVYPLTAEQPILKWLKTEIDPLIGISDVVVSDTGLHPLDITTYGLKYMSFSHDTEFGITALNMDWQFDSEYRTKLGFTNYTPECVMVGTWIIPIDRKDDALNWIRDEIDEIIDLRGEGDTSSSSSSSDSDDN